MWPFPRREPTQKHPESLTKRLSELELELIEVREIQEKTMAAIKRVQGKMARRVQLGEEPSGAEPAAEDGPPDANGHMALPVGGVDLKAQLRHRAAQMRGMSR